MRKRHYGMSDIGINDLVIVVRWPHEHGLEQLGRIYPVVGFAPGMRCDECSEHFLFPSALLQGPRRIGSIPISWLKRIDPPAIPEYVECDEGVTA
jgi:hypothetical protein